MLGSDYPIQRQLHEAIEAGDLKAVKAAIAAGAPVGDLHFEQGWPLSHAVDRNQPKIVQLLLEAGADPNCEDLMHMCIKRNYTSIARLLIKHGIDLNGCPTWEKDEDRFETSLIRAVRQERYEIAKALLEAGADANRRDGNEQSALLVAKLNKSKKLIKLLLEYASQEEKDWVEHQFSAEYAARLKLDKQILDAISAGDADKVEALFKTSGRDLNTPLEPDRDYPLAQAFHAFDRERRETDDNVIPGDGARHKAVIKRLAEMGARADLGNYFPPLWFVCGGGPIFGGGDAELDFVEFMIRHCHNIDARTLMDQVTSLMDAAYARQTNTVALLLKHGADPNARDRRGQSVLHHAKQVEKFYGPNPCIPVLLAAGAKE